MEKSLNDMGQSFMNNMGSMDKSYMNDVNNMMTNNTATNNTTGTGNMANNNTAGNMTGGNGMAGNNVGTQLGVANDTGMSTMTADSTAFYWIIGIAIVVVIALIIGMGWTGDRTSR